MKYIKLLKTFLFIVFLSGSFVVNLFAQCEGVYFKTANRMIFPAPVIFLFENNSKPLLYKDVTGDGKIDLIGIGQNPNKIVISPGDGNGNFGSLIEVTLSNQAQWFGELNVEDFDHDGLNDFFVKYSIFPRPVVIYRNNGGGSFTPLNTTIVEEAIENTADINSDGRLDLLTFTGPATRNYRLANADGSFGAPVQIDNNLSYKYAGDFNNDGKTDFAQTFGVAANQTIRILYNQGNGNFSLSGDLINIGYSGTTAYIEAVADFNNDGKLDILAKNGYHAVVVLNLGNGNFSRVHYELNQQSAVNFYIGDFTGDGFLDLLLKPTLATGGYSRVEKSYSIFTNNGAGAFTRRDYNVPIRGFPVGDLDGDNKSDLISNNNHNNSGFPSEPYRIFQETQTSYTKNVCRRPGQPKTVDFDGDTYPERTFFRPGDGRWRYIKSSDGVTVNQNWGISGDITQPGDYDGDGKTDIAVFRPSNGTWYIINSSNGSYATAQFGTGGDKPVSSDFDGDGTTDIAVFRPSDGNWYIYHTGTGQVSIAHFGIAEDKPVQEDYDADGKTDLAVFRPSTGVWYYLKSSDGNFAAINWGINTDIPAPADFDGDGKADITVYRASENNWYILRSFNLQFAVYKFGIAGDIPQVSDWDGNGIFDLGVYRPDIKGWYSSSSSQLFVFGETGEIPTSSIIAVQ